MNDHAPKISIDEPLKKTQMITKHLKTMSKCQKMDNLYQQVIQRNFQIIDDLLRKLDLVFIKHEQFQLQLTNYSKSTCIPKYFIGLIKMQADIDAIHNQHRRDNLHISSNIQNLKYELNGIDQHIKIIYDDYKKCGLTPTPTIKSCKNLEENGGNLLSSHKCFSNLENLESCADDDELEQGLGDGEKQNLSESRKSNVNFADNQNQNGNQSNLSNTKNNKYRGSYQKQHKNQNGLSQSNHNGVKRLKHEKTSNKIKDDDIDQQNQNGHRNNMNRSTIYQLDKSGKLGTFKRKINGNKKNQLRKSLDDKIDINASINKKDHNNKANQRYCGTTATIRFMDQHQNCTKSASNLLADGYLRQDFIQPRQKVKKITIMSDIRNNKYSQHTNRNNNNNNNSTNINDNLIFGLIQQQSMNMINNSDNISNHNSSNQHIQQLMQHQQFKMRFKLYQESFKEIARKLDLNTLGIKENSIRIQQLLYRCKIFASNDRLSDETFKLSKDIKKLQQQCHLSYANKAQTRKALIFLQSKLKSSQYSTTMNSISTCNTNNNLSQHNNNNYNTQQQLCSIVSKCLSCNRNGSIIQEGYSRFGSYYGNNTNINNNGVIGGMYGDNSGRQEKRLKVKQLKKKTMDIIKSGDKMRAYSKV